MVTKQGSNHFHGQLFEYLQNSLLSANSFSFNRIGQDRSKLNRNQFGANIGGPILKNKAFIFADYSGFRQRTVTNPQLNVPTPAMRSGDFSAVCTSFDASGKCLSGRGQQLYDLSAAVLSANQIPVSMFTSQAKALLAYYPVPNFPGSSNFKAGAPNGTGNFIDTRREGQQHFHGSRRLSDQRTRQPLRGGQSGRREPVVRTAGHARELWELWRCRTPGYRNQPQRESHLRSHRFERRAHRLV